MKVQEEKKSTLVKSHHRYCRRVYVLSSIYTVLLYLTVLHIV